MDVVYLMNNEKKLVVNRQGENVLKIEGYGTSSLNMLMTDWEGAMDVGYKASNKKKKAVLNGENDKGHISKARFETSVSVPQLSVFGIIIDNMEISNICSGNIAILVSSQSCQQYRYRSYVFQTFV